MLHEYAADTRDISNTFAGGGGDFLVYGENLGRDWGLLGVGLTTQLRDRVRIGVHFDSYVTPNSEAYGGMGQVQLTW